jgi:hypothetical protein
MTESPLVKKLLVKPGFKMYVVNAPLGYAEGLSPLPDGARVVGKPEGQVDFVPVFVRSAMDVRELVPKANRSLKPRGLLWVSYPKGSSKIKTDLNRDKLWTEMGEFGLVGVTLVSLDDTWSAFRFRPSAEVGK